jgi:hypothetical protein
MNKPIDPDIRAAYRKRLAEAPKSFLDYPVDVVFSLDPAELDAIRLSLAKRRFSAAKNNIEMVRRLADQNQISSIDGFNDLLPLLYTQETFKSYPQSWLETGDFKRLTRWMGKLCAVDLSGVDTSSCELIEDWIKALAQRSTIDLLISAGAHGKAAFLPRSRDEWMTFECCRFWNYQSAMTGPNGESLALRPGIDKVPMIHPGARGGARSSGRFFDFYEKTFGPGLVDAPLGYNDSDLLSLAGRIREASKKGETGSLQINPKLLARKDEIARINAENPQRIEALMKRLTTDYRNRRILFNGSMQMLYDLAMRLRDQGIKAAYTPDSFFFCGGGFATGQAPPNWQQEVAEALGVPESSIIVGYGMMEALCGMQLCSHEKYHVPVSMIPFVLDESNDQPLPRTGRQTGRLAFLDLLPETSWGGYVSSDHITITWDKPCGCGHKGSYFDAAISKVIERQDDKIGCAGTANALDDATDFLLKA